MEKELFDILADKYLSGEASEGEKKLLEEYLRRLGEKKVEDFSEVQLTEITNEIYKRVSEQIEKEKTPVIPFRRKPLVRIAAAAAVVLILLSGYWLIFNQKNEGKIARKEIPANKDFSPGSDVAILTLDNGKQIVLDTAKGTIDKQGDVTVINLNGKISYNRSSQKIKEEIAYHTISTPRGGQYQLTMADGSQVWLNSLSSIRFPTLFSGSDRRVEITGEAYFEVAHDASKPFHVTVNGMDIQVLGTHFNVNAYTDEPAIKTTLLEGSVKISKGNKLQMLSPGEQAQLNYDGDFNLVKNADVDAAVAWKNGLFNLKGANIKEIMRQISRWYKADIEYEGDVSGIDFYGEVSRRQNVSELLTIMEKTGIVHFKIEGEKIIVSK